MSFSVWKYCPFSKESYLCIIGLYCWWWNLFWWNLLTNCYDNYWVVVIFSDIKMKQTLQDVVPNYPKESAVEWMDAEDTLFLLYTSGSTGKPKVHSTEFLALILETFHKISWWQEIKFDAWSISHHMKNAMRTTFLSYSSLCQIKISCLTFHA